MQRIGSYIIPCSIHKDKKVGFLCTKSNCKKRLICPICTKDHESSHENYFISIVEVFTSDFEGDCDQAYLTAQSQASEFHSAQMELDKAIDSIKDDINNTLEIIREELKSQIEYMDPDALYSKLQQAKMKVIEILDLNPDELLKSQVELADSFSNFSELKSDIMKAKPSCNYAYDKKSPDELKKILMKFLKRISGSSGKLTWAWNPTKMSSKIELTEENHKLTLPSGNSGNHGVIGDTLLKEGIHQWYIEFDPNISTSAWGIGFGIVKKSKADSVSNYASFPYDDCICRASDGHNYNLTNVKSMNHRGKKTLCVLNFDESTFEIHCDGEKVATTKIEKDQEYYPFIDFNTTGYCKLVFD